MEYTINRLSFRRFIAFAGLLLIVIASLFVYLNWQRNRYPDHNPRHGMPLTEAEREMLGLWQLQYVGPKTSGYVTYELHSDRTCTKRFCKEETGESEISPAPHVWWRDGDELTLRNLYGACQSIWGIWDRSCQYDSILSLTPDGQGRFTFLISIECEGLNIPKTRSDEKGVMVRKEQ